MLWGIEVIAITSYAHSVPFHVFFSFETLVEFHFSHVETGGALHTFLLSGGEFLVPVFKCSVSI